MNRFELATLSTYDDVAVLAEIRRVAALLSGGPISITEFDAVSRVHSSTLRKRFGSWPKALRAAGLSNRVDERNRMRSREEVLGELKAVAAMLGVSELTKAQFNSHASFQERPVLRVFGSWRAALKAAGLAQSPLARRYSDNECFENLLHLWTHYGRQPKFGELNVPPSVVRSKAYLGRWGTWRAALAAFVEAANTDADATVPPVPEAPVILPTEVAPPSPHFLSVGMRYRILRRDRFRCTICGASPAASLGVELHIDHMIPQAKGGLTVGLDPI